MAQAVKRILAVGFSLYLAAAAPIAGFAQPGGSQLSSAGITLLQSGPGGWELDLAAPEYSVLSQEWQGRQYQELQVPGASLTADPGQPQAPVFNVLLGIPASGSVTLEVVSDPAERLPGNYRLLPAPQPVPLQEDFGSGLYSRTSGLPASPETSAFQPGASSLYPRAAAWIAEEAWVRDQRIIRLAYAPFQWNATDGSLVWHKSMRIRLHLTGVKQDAVPTAPQTSRADPFEAVLADSLINYTQARSWRGSSLQTSRVPPPAGYSAADSGVGVPPSPGGPVLRIVIDRDGMVRLTYADLQAAGLPVSSLDPSTFRLVSQQQDVALAVQETDGDSHRFSPGEAILFYGQKFTGDRLAARYSAENRFWLTFPQHSDTITTLWKPQFNAYMLERYTDENIYWLAYGGAPGLRMSSQDGAPQGAPFPGAFTTTQHAEQQHVWKTWLFAGEDPFYWQRIQNTTPATFTYTTTLTLPITSGPYTATLQGEVVTGVYNPNLSPDHHIRVYLNDLAHAQPLVDVTWDGSVRYHFSAVLPPERLKPGENRLDMVVIPTGALAAEDLYFDWFEITYPRQVEAQENTASFNTDKGGAWTQVVPGFTRPDLLAYDITDPLRPVQITSLEVRNSTPTLYIPLVRNDSAAPAAAPPSLSTPGQERANMAQTYTARFQLTRSGPARFSVLSATAFLTPKSIGPYTPPDLSNPENGADYLFITHHDLLTATQALADYRAAQGLTTQVIDVADLYNEFNDGIYHPIAIKNFLATVMQTWTKKPAYVLLVGDGHWNFKAIPDFDNPPIYMPPNLAWVDPWQGEVDSANLLATVVGDDPLPDLMIARLPVNSPDEITAYLNKLQTYESAGPGEWQRHMVHVADNGDQAGDFPQMSDSMAISYTLPGFTADKVYLTTTGAAARTALLDLLNGPGASLVNYTGHGTFNFWAAERIFASSDLPELANGDKLPVILSMTCLDGYWFHPNLTNAANGKTGQSLAEEMVRAAGKGAIATFSPTGLGLASGHDSLENGFLSTLVHQGAWGLGQAALNAKLRLWSTGANYDLLHTFTVFGDPALQIQNPYRFTLDSAETSQSATPGNSATFRLHITNTSVVTDSFTVSIPDNGWQVNAPAVVGPLAPGGIAEITLQVQVPGTAPVGTNRVMSAVVTSEGDRAKIISLLLTVEVVSP